MKCAFGNVLKMCNVYQAWLFEGPAFLDSKKCH